MNTYTSRSQMLVLGLVLLGMPGCSWFGSSSSEKNMNDGSEVLLTINGKPALTAKQFEDELTSIGEANPQVKMMLEMMPAVRVNVFSQMAVQKVLKLWADKANVKDTEEYKKRQEAIEQELAGYAFQQELLKEIVITEEEALKYYEENKTSIPDFVVTAGGTKATKSGIEVLFSS